jgi:uncharacterized membrane protein
VTDDRHSPFGRDRFGRWAESAARFFGTPQYIVGQSVLVVIWVALNSLALLGHWDPYPFILLNLAFSTQAAYAAPLILLAQTRQAERDKHSLEKAESHRDQFMERIQQGEDAIKQEIADLRKLLTPGSTPPRG